MWIFLVLSAWLILSVPLALFIGSFIGSHKLPHEQTTSASSSEREGQGRPDSDNDHPQRPAA
jgi:hypothetical protein